MGRVSHRRAQADSYLSTDDERPTTADADPPAPKLPEVGALPPGWPAEVSQWGAPSIISLGLNLLAHLGDLPSARLPPLPEEVGMRQPPMRLSARFATATLSTAPPRRAPGAEPSAAPFR
jgi:hypothetical protein